MNKAAFDFDFDKENIQNMIQPTHIYLYAPPPLPFPRQGLPPVHLQPAQLHHALDTAILDTGDRVACFH